MNPTTRIPRPQAACGFARLVMAAIVLSAAPLAADEWTMESARQQWPAMTQSVEHVGVPGCQWQVGVFWDGAMLFGQTLLRGELYHHPRLADELKLANVGDNLLHLSVGFGERMRLVDRTGTNSPAIRKGLQEGRLPIPFVETRDGDLVWRETVFAHLLDRKMEDGMSPRPDDVLVVQARFTVRNAGSACRTAHLWLHFGDTSQTRSASHQLPELAAAIPHSFAAPFGVVAGKVRYVIPAPAAGALRWHDAIPPPLGMKNPAQQIVEWQVLLVPGGQAELRVVIPYGLVERDVAARAAALDFDKLHDEVARFWRSIVNTRCQIRTPDPFLNDYLAAVSGQIAEQIGYRHQAKVWMLKTSPNWYEDYYVSCAARALSALDLRGLQRYSRPVLESFIDSQSDDPAGLLVDRQAHTAGLAASEGFVRHRGFLGNFGLPGTAVPVGDPRQGWSANTSLMNHGLALWALAAHYRITRDRRWLDGAGTVPIFAPAKMGLSPSIRPRSPLQAILDACDWIAVQRRRTMREENGHWVPQWGLLPAASAHDWLSGSVIFNDAWCIAGMTEAVRLLAEIGHPRYAGIARELQDYRACLNARYSEARDRARRVPLDDGTTIPFVPRMVGELDWASVDWTYAGYGPLRAGGLGAIDPHDPLVDQTLAFLDAGRPTGQGTVPIFVPTKMGLSPSTSQREHFWQHYVEPETHWPMYDVFLNRDDLPRFFELFFNNLVAAVHADFRVGCEGREGVVSVSPADAEHWRMVRDMFVRETDETGTVPIFASTKMGLSPSPVQQGLFLLQAIPRSWLRPGEHLAASEIGTNFGGKVSIDLQMAADGNSVAVGVQLAGLAVKPREIHIRLRCGDGRPLASASVNGQPAAVQPGDIVTLPVETDATLRIVGRF